MILNFLAISLCCFLAANGQEGTGGGQGTDNGEVPPKVHQILQLSIPVETDRPLTVSNLVLECIASGNPAPVISWSFENVELKNEGVDVNNQKFIFEGNQLTVRNVKGVNPANKNEKHDSGRYRCIATNKFGSVFMEKMIHIRVLGSFHAQNTQNKDASKFNPTVNKNFKIECPQHSKKGGWGTSFQWGYLPKGSDTPIYWRPGNPNPRFFINYDTGTMWFSVVLADDITESRDIGGLRCILVNHRLKELSNQQLLWAADSTLPPNKASQKPQFEVFMPERMTAPVNSAYSIFCGALGNPNPEYTWKYQGIDIVSRRNGSDELNFEFFRFRGKMKQELYITRITQYSGGTFRCTAGNSFGGNSQFKEGQLTVLFPPKWITNFPDILDLPVGNTIKLVCNATGTPAPIYFWYQNGQRIVNDVSLNKVISTDGHDDRKNDNGGVLTIKQAVAKDDDGIYICVASNSLDTLTQSVYLRVADEAPRFDVPLDDPIYLFRNTKMTIKCNPSGGPPPTQKWQKDGADLDVTTVGSRFKVTDQGLEISNVIDADAGKYTCTAENGIGSPASSSGTAVVLEKTVITRPIREQTHSQGWEYAVFYCGCEWDRRLDLRIEWQKEGIKMAKFDDRVYLEDRATGPPRLLYITNLTIQDAGNYSCKAYTKVGDVESVAEAWALLRIKGPPEPPAAVQISGNCRTKQGVWLNWKKGEELAAETRHFYIEFSTNTSAHLDRWFGGIGDPLVPDSMIRVSPGTQTSYNLDRHLVPGASLIFRVRAQSDLMLGRASRPTQIGLCNTDPGPPVLNPLNVTGITRGEGTLFIRWRPLSDVYYGSTGFFYLVGWRQKPKEGQPAGDFQFERITKNLTYANEFPIPSPGINVEHEFFVQSGNDKLTEEEMRQKRDADPSMIKSAVSGNKRPERPPSNVRVTDIKKFSVQINWDPAPEATSYRIKYWNVTDAEALRGRSKRAASDPIVFNYAYSENPNFGTLVNLTAQVDFLATVASVNSGGTSEFESELISFTTKARRPGVPSNVQVVVYGSSAHISWQPPLEPNGYIEQYEISWQTNDDGQTDTELGRSQLNKDRRSREAYLINQFTPFTYYDLKLAARNRVGGGQQWEHILFTVSAPDIPGKPGAPMAKPFDDSAINITFQRPTFGGLPTSFFVYYRPRGDYFQAPKIVSQAFPKRAWVLVKDLDFLVYDFWTVGVNHLGQSETSDVTEQQPLRKLKPQAHASEFPWWRSNWFVAICLCVVFILITMITVIILLKDGPKTYKRLSEQKYNNGYGQGSGGYNNSMPMQSKPQQPPPSQSSAPTSMAMGATAAGFGAGAAAASMNDRYDRNFSNSEAEDHDAPPPRYSSQSSVEKKEPYSGSETGSETGSDYSGSETGSETGSDYSDEDGSYYSDEEKKRSDSEDEEDEGEEDTSTFV